MKNHRKKKMKKVRYTAKQNITRILVILLFAAVGSYVLFSARAATSSPIDAHIDATGTLTEPPVGQAAHADFYVRVKNVSSKTQHIKPHVTLNLTPGAGGTVSVSNMVWGNFPYVVKENGPSTYERDSDGWKCLDLAPGQDFTLLSFHLTATANGAYYNTFDSRQYYRVSVDGVAWSVPCAAGDGGTSIGGDSDSKSGAWRQGSEPVSPPYDECPNIAGNQPAGYNCNPDATDPCQTTGCPLGGGNDEGSKETNQGTNGNNGTSNGTGGGMTANKQTTKNNPLPSSGSTGTNNQIGVEPSPFIDGDKTYQPGSDPDTLGSSSIFNKRIFKGRYIIFGVLLLGGAGAGGYYYWRRKK